MSMAISGQWILLVGHLVLLLWSLIIFLRKPRSRPMTSAILAIAITHVAYYITFLIYPDWLDYDKTMLFSVIIRLQVLFSLMLGLALAQRRLSWK